MPIDSNKVLVKRRRLVIGLMLLLLAATCDYLFYPYGTVPPGRTGNIGENGLWLNADWYSGRNRAYDSLTAEFRQSQCRYAYFHVHNVDRNGNLVEHSPETAQFLVERLHKIAPNTRLIAWVYVGNASGRGHVDLSQPQVRARMVQEAVWLTTVCGFDGVQWDYEICRDGDPGFIDLLLETRTVLQPGKLLSVATPLLLPNAQYGWSDMYYGQVSASCDQVVVMCYDTAATFPRAYQWLTMSEVRWILRDVSQANPSCRVLIGVPTYTDQTLSHNTHAENLRLALRGVREGLVGAEIGRRSFAGIAIFAEYTTTTQDWKTYRRLWPPRA
jgi:hypothetical protein